MNGPSTDRASVTSELAYHSFIEDLFLRLAYEQRLNTLVTADWLTRADVENCPGAVLANQLCNDGTELRVLRLESSLLYLTLRDEDLKVRIAAPDTDTASAVRVRIAEALPEASDTVREVRSRFWWWDVVAESTVRRVPAPPWSEVAVNYSQPTRAMLEALVGWDSGPARSGRLMLWHGEPGTGKTSAIRTLSSQWRSWADFQYIADPEQLLAKPAYLLSAITDVDESSRTSTDRWKVVVLEDSGEFLAPDAGHIKGQALSRLLNVCDGVLGQAMRALVLVTTNEPIRALHPALVRPGRCLSEIEFRRLEPPEVTEWCRVHGVEPTVSGSATLADLFARRDGAGPATPRPTFGFADID